MKEVSEQIETLIVRQLDGQISEDDELTLNRELIRNPEARGLQDSYRRVDALSAAALNDALARPSAFDVEALPHRGTDHGSGRFVRRWLAPGAAVAALLALAVARLPFDGGVSPNADQAAMVQHPSDPIVPVVGPVTGPGDMRYNASLGRPSVKRDTGRGVIGVVGDDGNIYWIEVDRTRTLRRPNNVRF